MLTYLPPYNWKFSIDDLARDFKGEKSLDLLVTELEKRGYLRKNLTGNFELSAISYEREQELENYWDFAYQPISSFDLSTRIHKCLLREEIIYLGELLELKDSELIKSADFGKKSVNEVEEFLAKMGLKLGMKIPFFVLKKIKSLREQSLSMFPQFIKDRFPQVTAKEPIYIGWWTIKRNFVFPNCNTEEEKIERTIGYFNELEKYGSIITSWKRRKSDNGHLWGFYLIVSDNFASEIKKKNSRLYQNKSQIV